MTNNHWIRAAMSDDALVAEALLRLHHAEPPPRKSGKVIGLKLEWSVRHRRSKVAPPTTTMRKEGDQARASPTAPLSWSCASSFSGGGAAAAAEGVEESSGAVKPSETVRSKIPLTSGATPFKRSKKKKTLAELKEEESQLSKERKSLRSELACVRALLEQQRARNDALKKLKAESQGSLPCNVASALTSIMSSSSPNNSSSREESNIKTDTSFLLPDLNMPLENDPSPEVLCGSC